MASTAAEVGARAKRKESIRLERPPGGARRWLALAFLAPALLFLGAIVLYPTIDTIAQSFQNTDRQWVGVANYQDMFSAGRVVGALRNNAIWVATAPAIITGLGLVFAVLTERVPYQKAIKIVLFMPMAISFLATGVIWRIMYEQDPGRGLVNAALGGVYETVRGPGAFPQAVVPGGVPLRTDDSGAVVTRRQFEAGSIAPLGLTGITPADLPEDAEQARAPDVSSSQVGAVVWNDFKPGGGEAGVVEDGEFGLPGVTVQLLNASGDVVASDESAPDGGVVFDGAGEGPFRAQVAASTFSQGFTGIEWLSESLVTPAIIGAFCWMWAGFAVVVVGAGLAALPRDVLEAARVDGANEWQTFRFVTVPLLRPVLGVVFITLVINVLKIFDIVLVLAPGAVQDDADVIALQMWRTSFTGLNYGVGSAIAVLLFLLVVPVMWLNVKRFKSES